MAFKDKLRELRKLRHYTQDDLSKLTGLSVSAISMYENGKREPSFETLEMFADYFNVDMNTLIGKEEEVKEKKKPLTAREFMRIICKGDKEALAIVERLKLTQDGDLEITGADMLSSALLNLQIQNVVAALKKANITDDGMAAFEVTPRKEG